MTPGKSPYRPAQHWCTWINFSHSARYHDNLKPIQLLEHRQIASHHCISHSALCRGKCHVLLDHSLVEIGLTPGHLQLKLWPSNESNQGCMSLKWIQYAELGIYIPNSRLQIGMCIPNLRQIRVVYPQFKQHWVKLGMYVPNLGVKLGLYIPNLELEIRDIHP